MTVFHRNRNKVGARRRAQLSILISCLALVAHAHAAGPVVVLIGIPGSGTTTQAATLQKERGMAVISADELIARNPRSFEKARKSAVQGFDPRLDPALNDLVEAALATTDLSKGLVLVGYPSSKTQGDFLAALREKLNLPKALVINLVVPDKVARKQLQKEKVADIEQQLLNYHRELDFSRVYFPQADIRDVKGNQKPAKVANDIRKLLPN